MLLEKKKYPIPTDLYHYIPKVTITENKKSCAIIASELRSISDRTQQYLIDRVTNLYECAIKNKHNVIVLGAWGCGAFKETDDDAIIMANVFKKVEAKYKDQIKTVYAVLYKTNYEIFKKLIE